MENEQISSQYWLKNKFKQNNRCCQIKNVTFGSVWDEKDIYQCHKSYLYWFFRVLWWFMEVGGWRGNRTLPEGLRANFIFVHSFLPRTRNSSANGLKFHCKSSDYHSSSGRSSSRGWKGKANNLVLSTAILPFVLRDQRQAWEDLMSVKLWRRSGLRKARSG